MENPLPVGPPLATSAGTAWQPARQPGMLVDQLLALRRRWRMILLVTLLLSAIAALILSGIPPRYTATGILLYDPADSLPPGNLPSPNITSMDEDAITASQGAIITSLPSAALLASRLNISVRPEFNPALRRKGWFGRLLQRWFHVAPIKSSTGRVALKVQKALAVNILPGSRVISVSFSSRDPGLAAAGANLAMQLYLEHERYRSFQDLADAQSWLEGNALTLQDELDRTETELVKARADAGIVPGAQASLTNETASRIAASLVSAQAALAMAQARLASAPDGDAAAANAAIAPSLQPLRKEQADLMARVESLERQYGPDYPDLVSTRTSLAAIDSQISAETERELQAARAEVAADQAQVATLAAALNSTRAQSQEEDVDATPIRALEQRADAERAMLRSVTVQADQLAQQSALTKPNARILSEAPQPDAPSAPHRLLLIGAATALGFFLGLLLAGLADALDTSFRSGGDVRAELGLACLALVPEVRRPGDVLFDAPFSVFSEQMRALRAELLLRDGTAQFSRVLAITAARPGEGKTTLTVSLARALALSGLRVLAIDGDIRQPSFDALFQTAGAVGLTDHLAGLARLEDAILPDRRTPLHVMPAGAQGRETLSLFLSPAMPSMLEELRSRYDLVVMDVPPIFALAEARVLARAADAAVLCVRWGKTPRRVAHAAMTILEEAGAGLIGVALTRVDSIRHGRSGFPDAEIYQSRYGGYFRN